MYRNFHLGTTRSETDWRRETETRTILSSVTLKKDEHQKEELKKQTGKRR